VPDDFDWEALARQFQQEDSVLRVAQTMAKFQGTYYKTLLAEGFDKTDAVRATMLLVSEISKFARDTIPVLTQQFINWKDDT